jgi:putative glutamine amidotransferase
MTAGVGPLVAVSTYSVAADWVVWSASSSLTPNTYLDRLDRAGALPVMLPSLTAEPAVVDRLLDAVSAVVLIGGEDICGRAAGRDEAEADHAAHNPERDRFEIALAQRAWERDVPTLGICRGMQVLNVARGGTLIPDLPSVGASPDHRVEPGVFTDHPVAVEPDSRLWELFGEQATARSHHHQAIDRVGDGLRVTGRAPDAVVEAVEDPTRRFFLGVQWHPEESDDLTLFEALVEAATVSA